MCLHVHQHLKKTYIREDLPLHIFEDIKETYFERDVQLYLAIS